MICFVVLCDDLVSFSQLDSALSIFTVLRILGANEEEYDLCRRVYVNFLLTDPPICVNVILPIPSGSFLTLMMLTIACILNPIIDPYIGFSN